MDQRRFDDLARSTAVGASRRALLRGLAGGALGGALALLGGGSARAQNRCSAFCKELPPGRERGRCRADCAHGEGLFVRCGEDPDRLCLAADGTAICCDAGRPCVDGACEPPPPPPPPPGGDGCVCSLTAEGEPCAADGECCTGYCADEYGLGQAICTYGEVMCAGVGAFCANDADGGNECCSDVCEGCACTCLAPGTACETDRPCCGRCEAGRCCSAVDDPCTDGSDCGSGFCNAGTCGRGGGGAPCRGAGECDSLACCGGVCCSYSDAGAYCRYDGTRDVCASY